MLRFNDVDLEQYIIIDDGVEIEELAERINTTIDIPSMNGEVYVGHKYGRKLIKVPFFIDARVDNNYTQIVREIKNILHTDVESKLFLPNEPDKYYWAVINNFTSNEIYKGVGKGEIEFICFDPYAYSDELKLFEADINRRVTVENNGTAETSPIINIGFTKDTNFVQVSNWDGRSVLIGNRPSVDEVTSKPSNLVLHDKCETTTDWLPAGNVVDADRIVEGNVTISEDGNYIVPGSYGSTTDQKWHGAAVRRNIGVSVENFKLVARMQHNSLNEGGSSGSSGSSGTTTGNYTVKVTSLNVRSGAGTSYKIIGSLKKNTTVNVTSVTKGWGKISYNGKTGYISLFAQYVTKTSKSINNYTEKSISTENKMGRMELYGFDINGNRLFKCILRDSEEFYEYTQPEIEIGTTLVLEDNVTCPPAKTQSKKDGDKKVTEKIPSGRIGSWNEFYGDFIIERKTVDNKQIWDLTVTKLKDGKVVNTLKKSGISNSKYPKGALNNLVLWFGQYKDKPTCDEVGLTDLKVYTLNEFGEEDNLIYFTNGDELEINCKENKVYLNGTPYMESVDIGSQFFKCPPGRSQFIAFSDDTDIYINGVIEEKYL